MDMFFNQQWIQTIHQGRGRNILKSLRVSYGYMTEKKNRHVSLLVRMMNLSDPESVTENSIGPQQINTDRKKLETTKRINGHTLILQLI